MDRQNQFLAACHQQYPVVISDIFRDVTGILKIGEGIFGEVYEGNIPIHEGTGDANKMTKVVFKVVPIQGAEKVNGERQKLFEEVRPEVIITEKLAQLSKFGDNLPHTTPGFIQMHAAYLATGEYPANLIAAWKEWDDVNESDNDLPKFAFDQKYMVLLFEHGGLDAGSYRYVDARQTFFMLMQTIHALAVAEAALEFEHRDMHGNNILIKPTMNDYAEYKLNGKVHLVPTFGLTPTIIDFTLSRIKDPEGAEEIFLDLTDDEEMFLSTGDYQFDIYRMMRDENRNKWGPFHPKTNLMWMHYLTDKFLLKGKWSLKGSDEHRIYYSRMQLLKSRLLLYPSCQAFVESEICARLLLPLPPSLDHKRKSSGSSVSSPKLPKSRRN